jgi:hypothetical protein
MNIISAEAITRREFFFYAPACYLSKQRSLGLSDKKCADGDVFAFSEHDTLLLVMFTFAEKLNDLSHHFSKANDDNSFF